MNPYEKFGKFALIVKLYDDIMQIFYLIGSLFFCSNEDELKFVFYFFKMHFFGKATLVDRGRANAEFYFRCALGILSIVSFIFLIKILLINIYLFVNF